MFSIEFVSEPYITEIDDPPVKAVVADAEIRIGDFREMSLIVLERWKKKDFQQQWLEGIRRIIENDFSKSILLTVIPGPLTGDGGFGWVLYREKDMVYIQEHGYCDENLSEPFDENNPYKHIRERETEGEEGAKISEWSCSIEDVKRFFKDEKAG